MSIKKRSSVAKRDSAWQKRRADAFGKVADGLVDIANAKKQRVAERIKTAGIKIKNTYKAKLGDDLRVFEYTIIKIDRFEGEVWLKSERGTVRKLRVSNEIFDK